jgi:acyl-coenzyme A synthetase/AMP-(fatty) acid ligase
MRRPTGPFNIATWCLFRHLPAAADRTALIVVDPAERLQTWTFGELALAVRRHAAVWGKLGLRPGARVLVRLPTSGQAVITLFAAFAAGLVPTSCSPMLTRREIGAIAVLTDAGLLVQDDDPPGADDGPLRIRTVSSAELATLAAGADPAPAPTTQAEDPAFLIFTSGTSGRPKGVLHAHRTVLGRRPMRPGWQGFGPGDRVLHAGQLNWTYTLGVGLMDPWAVGATAILVAAETPPERWPGRLAGLDVTVFAAVPTVYRRLLKYGDPASLGHGPLRHGLAAGEPLAIDVQDDWRRATGRPLFESLGMSEISTYVSSGPVTPIRPGSPGRAQPGRRIAILPETGPPVPLPPGEPGLLAVHRSDPGLMLGYWQDPEATAAAMRGSWFAGGDHATIDHEGYVHFRGRGDDVLNCQGYRVSAHEVEQVLRDHPEVGEVAVAADVRADGVEILTAFVVPARPQPDPASLLAFARERLATYKCPRRVTYLDALPRTANGKLIRSRLGQRPDRAGA